jgi:hypothetical protein
MTHGENLNQTVRQTQVGKVQIPIKHQLSNYWIKLALFSDWK